MQPPDQGHEPAAALGPPSRDPGDGPATCGCLLYQILLTKLFSKMPVHTTSEADRMMRWHKGGEARQSQSLHCTENKAVQGTDNPSEGHDSMVFPCKELASSPGAAGLWDPHLSAAGRGRSARTIRVRVTGASWVTRTQPDQTQAGTSSWPPPGDCPSSYFWGSPLLCSQGVPAASRVHEDVHEGFHRQPPQSPSRPRRMQRALLNYSSHW